ncbi:tetratricopeptide repeat protein [Noviherbaspirillum saxi]|uniref:Protein kinase G tetratricopeptide repeat containing domain-containing protein n=1 Tax=Noviherbaspirillum saxi TaxID=2320863 RepID=A0A3A3FTI5_9BURK|nr:tetratricopeptide repeat protein [Noviherbaspirillum saxi]RJF99492.1 hypothetical protein D3871_13875 [Noviherbaspirillum saxi]
MKDLLSVDRWRCALASVSAPVLLAAVAVAGVLPPPSFAQSQPDAPAAQPKPVAASSTSMDGIATEDLAPYPEVRAHLDLGNVPAALTALQTRERQHSDDPNYFNLVGILALKLADYATAVTAFERVVLMQPENAGAWLDLAIASAETGNAAGANAYFDYVETQFNPPPLVNVIISRYRARMAARAHISPWQISADAMFGVDSNANSGLQNLAIPITEQGERFDYLLDPTFQARSDRYIQAGVNARYRQTLGENTLDLSAGLRTRDYVHENSFSTVSANLSAGLYRATTFGDAAALLHYENLWLGGSSLLRNVRAVAQIEHPVENCRIGFSAESEWRRYADRRIFDANILWGQAGVACDFKLEAIPVQTILIGRAGFDDPVYDRAGGETRHTELIAQFAMPIAWGARLEFTTTFAKAVDREGYSALLEDNAARRLNRRNIRLGVTVPFTPVSDVMVLAEDNRFQSNLALFRQSGQSISVGYRYRFH